MADGLNDRHRSQLLQATDDHAARAPARVSIRFGRGGGPREQSPHSHKFRAAIALLVGIAIGAVVVALAAVGSSTKTASTFKWSDWQPSDSGTQGAREIADHLAPFYRISAVKQLDLVTVVNLSSPTAATSATSTTGASSGLEVAVRASPTSSQVSLLGGDTIAYNLCGIGTSNCRIAVGQPSPERLLLLRREALELALYTFKYIKGVQNVVAILPPAYVVQTSALTVKPPAANAKNDTQTVDYALLFIKAELTPWLNRPLSATFPEQFPPTVPEVALWEQTDAAEAGLVSQITANGLFTEKLQQAQDGSNLIVLDPQPPQ